MKDDQVGYGRPPKSSQYKKGQSGNLRGRPKREPPEFGNIIAQVINGDASYTEDGQNKTATRIEVGLRALLKQALTGNLGAAEQIYSLLKSAERPGSTDAIQIRVTGWLPDYPGQTGEQKKSDNPPG